MSVPPSFSSFPPSFGSFPDIGGAADTETSSTHAALRRDFKRENKQSDRKKKKRDGRDRSSTQRRIPSSERGSKTRGSQDRDQARDDERIKAEEDSARRAGQQDVSQLVFFSDKKGDPSSIQYGGIYTRDIPKYHLVGRG